MGGHSGVKPIHGRDNAGTEAVLAVLRKEIDIASVLIKRGVAAEQATGLSHDGSNFIARVEAWESFRIASRHRKRIAGKWVKLAMENQGTRYGALLSKRANIARRDYKRLRERTLKNRVQFMIELRVSAENLGD